MSWQNERGPKKITVFESNDKTKTFYLKGTILGQCTLNNHLILFSYISDSVNVIYDINFEGSKPLGKELYKGNLNFDVNSPIEALGVYENEKLQKVYWIDGINQARFINIVENPDILSSCSNTHFDFLPTDSINTQVSVEKVYNMGYFKAGTIQYVFTYFNQFGAQTNIFNITPIQYVSIKNIGMEVDRATNCSFRLNVSNVNPEFSMLRIYSIFRASQDTTPQVSIVKDIPIHVTRETQEDGSVLATAEDIEYIDNGGTNTAIDEAELLFLNNNRIIPKTMDQKDNTLFLGNFQYDALLDSEVKRQIQSYNASEIIEFYLEETPLITDEANQYYPYTNQLQFSSDKILGFKGGETYLFGFQLQDINDRWSSVILLGNITNKVYPKCEFNSTISRYEVHLVKARIKKHRLQSIWDTISQFKEASYKALKVVIVSKTQSQRNIICQGIVCPTVYCYEDRINHTAPYAQSSWFFRPQMKKPPYCYSTLQGENSFSYKANKGGIPEFRHYASLGYSPYGYTCSNNGEIQSMDPTVGPGLINLGLLDATKNSKSKKDCRHNFGVDASIVTFHSPDIEFNSAVQESLDRMQGVQFSIVGHGKLKDTVSKYETNVEKNTFMSMSGDRYYRTTVDLNQLQQSENPDTPAASLCSTWGVRTTQFEVQKVEDDQYQGAETGIYSYSMLFPWNRSTTVNEQSTPGVNYDWTAPLKTKIMSNMRVCGETKYLTDSEGRIDSGKIWTPKNGISQININDDTTKLIKIPNTSNIEYSYYGMIDTVLTNTDYYQYRYLIGCTVSIAGGILSVDLPEGIDMLPTYYMKPTFNKSAFGEIEETENNKFSDPIRMKYKSSTHAVFAFNPSQGVQEILPQLSLDTVPDYYKVTPEWVTSSISTQNLTNYEGGLFLDNSLQQIKTNIILLDEDVYNWNGQGIDYPVNFETGDEDYDRSYKGIIVSNINKEIKGDLTYAFAIMVDFQDAVWRNDDPSEDGRRAIWRLEYPEFKSNVIYYNNSYKLYIIDSLGDKVYKVLIVNKDFTPELGVGTTEQPTTKYRQSFYDSGDDDGIFYIAELKTKNGDLDTSDYCLQNYQWQAASNIIPKNSTDNVLFGDTYFQRYDCLKTYPYTDEDPNQIVDIASVMLETYINIDGRYDRNRGLLNNTTITNINFNMLNKAYTQADKFVQSYVNDKQYDVTRYPNSVMWSLTKVFGQDIDAWTHLTSTAILDLDGTQGELTKILNFQNNLVFFQTDGVGYIKYNENAALAASTGVPVELANSGKVDGKLYLNTEIGCQNKETIVITKNAMYFIDGNTHTIYQAKSPQELQAPTPISDNSFEVFMNKQDVSKVKSFFNRNTQDVYFIFNNTLYPCLAWNETLNAFSSFYNYTPDFMASIRDKQYHIVGNGTDVTLWSQNEGDFNYFYNKKWLVTDYYPFYMTVVANGEEAQADKIWNNLEFRSDSWDSAGTLVGSSFDLLDAWNEYQEGTMALTTMGSRTINNETFNSVRFPSSLKQKFRIHRTLFPRAKSVTPNFYIKGEEKTIPNINGSINNVTISTTEPKKTRDRIRNPWTYLRLTANTENTNRTVLHDINVYYYQ